MKIGIITDPGGVARWQAEALRQIAADNEFLIYECTNSRSKRRPLAHGLYFLLNLLAVRNAMTAGAPLPRELRIAGRTVFSAETDGAWQRLPRSLLDHIAADGPQLIIKFGMGLLRIPPADQLACPILSFHHGDPRQFRGRPAGFYEILAEAPVIGQVVQILSNALDAGAVVAFAESKAHPYSWRQSLIDAYRVSPALLPLAIRNATNGITLPIARNGPNRRLPDNATAARFAMKIGAAKLRRLAYGGLVEKGWEVAEADLPSDWSPDRLASLLEAAQWRTLPRPRRYRFFADPFFHPSGEGAILEAMRPTGEAEIVHVHRNECAKLAIAGRHCSYPATFQFAGRDLLLPEVSDWSAPRLFELTDAGVTDCGELDLPGKPLLLDATIEVHHGACYLFGNRRDEGDRILRLWVTDSPFGAFTEHPASPIRISPAGARMAGRILHSGGRLYRPGQDLRRAYGDGLLLFAIEEFSTIAYRESEATPLRFTGHRGPHTLNIRGNKALFDYYDDRFSLLAGLRRLRQSRAG